MAFPTRRPLEEEALTLALRSLAEVSAIAWSLRQSLEPLSVDDIALGGEALSSEQIKEELKTLENKLAAFATYHLKATPGEWSDAVLSIA